MKKIVCLSVCLSVCLCQVKGQRSEVKKHRCLIFHKKRFYGVFEHEQHEAEVLPVVNPFARADVIKSHLRSKSSNVD